MQYLYGSGEGAAVSQQTWRAIVSHVARRVAAPPADSVVLAPDATLAAPTWVPCGTKPKAVVFDVDETVLLNIGFEYDDATRATIEGAGLGPAVHGETLYLAGDDSMGNKKDGRRATIAAKFYVLAIAGDQLGDFGDLFNAGLAPAARRAAVRSDPLIAKFGAGWFVLPNPVYGTALKGTLGDVFPTDKRWTAP